MGCRTKKSYVDILLLKLKLGSKRDYAVLLLWQKRTLEVAVAKIMLSHMKGCETTTDTNSIWERS